MIDLDSESGAIFSDDHRYRYLLWRNWVPNNQRRLLWVMLNPSTADGQTDDMTVRRCMGFSKKWEYGGLEIVNLFAYRTPKPDVLEVVVNPIGSENDRYVREAAERATEIVVAWGEFGTYRDRDCEVLDLLSQYAAEQAADQLRCLDHLPNGCPRHPAHMSLNTKRQRYWGYKKRCH